MRATYKSKINLSGLQQLRGDLKAISAKEVHVGVLDDTMRTRDRVYERHGGLPIKVMYLSEIKPGSKFNNATVGKNMEYGTSSDGAMIPARSWLREPLMNHLPSLIKDGMVAWKRADATEFPTPAQPAEGFMTKSVSRLGSKVLNLSSLLKFLGTSAKEICKASFKTNGYGRWESNGEGTIMSKGKNDPGNDTHQLRDAIDYEIV